jgi:hypothetical protein
MVDEWLLLLLIELEIGFLLYYEIDFLPILMFLIIGQLVSNLVEYCLYKGE